MRTFSLLLTFFLAACSKSTTSPTPEDPPPFGGACDDGCEELACLDDARFPGGYCTAPCPCEEGSTCVTDYGPELCFAACTTDMDCRDGYACWRGTCRPPCTADGECGAMASCVAGVCDGVECAIDDECGPATRCVDNRCVPDLPDAGIDAPVDCSACDPATSVCLPAALGGGCASRCVDASGCAGSTLCSRVRTDVDGDGTTDMFEAACLPLNPDGRLAAGPCAVARELDDCESRSCNAGQCVEVCDDDTDCLLGQTCRIVTEGSAESRICWYLPISSPFDEIELGEFDVRAGASSPRVNFAVPPDAKSIVFIAERVGGDDLPLSFVNVWDPTNARIYDLSQIAMLVDQPIRWLPVDSNGAIGMLLPNTTVDRWRFGRGRYGVSVGALSDSPADMRSVTIRLRAMVKRVPVDMGTIDVNLFIAPGLGINAGSAPGNARVQGTIDRLNATYAPANISFNVVGYFDVSGSQFSVIDSTDGPTSELGQLFSQSAGRSNHALNIFLVRSISAGGGSTLGIAGGVPGPPAVHGTGHSGVVVSFDTGVVGGGSTIPGQIMSHEVGHYLGLFHNVENDPACTGGAVPPGCSPFGGEDPIADTNRTNRNLMFWALQTFGGGTVNDRMTDGQAFVLIRNPLAVR